MSDALYLAARYLRASPWRTAVLVAGTAIALFLPLFTWMAASEIERELLARARSTPIVVGSKSDEFDLVMSSLYFRGQVSDAIEYREVAALESRRYGRVVPLFVRYSVDGSPLVGTSLDYFDQRSLRVAQGRYPVRLGEVAVGAVVAAASRLAVGDTVRSDLTNLYNLAGSYPIVLRVVGVLAPNGTPDDEAFFCDVRTTWAIEGRLHGHDAVVASSQDAPAPGQGEAAALAEDDNDDNDDNVEATAAIFLFTEINESNLDSFHLHGDQGDAPITSMLAFPPGQREKDLLLGDYALEETRQATEPVQVIRTVLGIVLRLRDTLTAYFWAVAASTLAFFVLVITLSLRLRAGELQLMRRIGSSRATIFGMITAEIALVAISAATIALFGAWVGVLWFLPQVTG